MLHKTSANPQENSNDAARLEQTLGRLYGLHPKLIDLSLGRMLRFLDDLGNPHLSLPPVIHVAGTNGKGSTVATCRALLEAHGYSCHVATSPHLIRINERIVIAGQVISSTHFADLLDECMQRNNGKEITFFEMIMAATFLAFSREKADFCILETGLGGRLDATNVIPKPAVTIITTISYDHRDFLGNTLPAIAAEKAGIIKQGVPCILGAQTPESIAAGVIDTISSIALSTDAPLHRFGTEWSIAPEAGQMRFVQGADSFLLPLPSLCGSHQIYNTGGSIAALRVIPGLDLDPRKISTGLGQIYWPGRLQRLQGTVFNRILPEDASLWIDGGHNDSGGAVLAEQISNWKSQDVKKVHLVLGMLTRKEPLEFMHHIVSKIDSLTLIPVPSQEKSFDPHTLSQILSPVFKGPLCEAESVQHALEMIRSNFPDSPHVLITGSLYLMGHILEACENAPE